MFLTDLVMLDTVMNDYVDMSDPGAWNSVLNEIQLLQVAADKFHIQPQDQLWAWFQAVEWLSENESQSPLLCDSRNTRTLAGKAEVRFSWWTHRSRSAFQLFPVLPAGAPSLGGLHS
ncbi:Ral guanine nucleotide dissociation stimulator [Tupaia chinensis]|uniref:Ral guanine nucleotide dissociation stimulator n=1 Tax=Tupaia chinensis TaxID=246437 RepID=L9KM67_TUPCH|nr:Ral guanine nucleotide dissociation stimulator [Tupaia chinensis]